MMMEMVGIRHVRMCVPLRLVAMPMAVGSFGHFVVVMPVVAIVVYMCVFVLLGVMLMLVGV